MRLKLVLLTSLVGAVIGAGASVAIVVARFGSWVTIFDPAISAHVLTGIVVQAIPLAAALVAGFFIYRHTARRRKLQAGLTAILVLILCLLTYIALTLGFVRL